MQSSYLNVKIAGIKLGITSFYDEKLFEGLKKYITAEDELDFSVDIVKSSGEIPPAEGKKLTQRNDDNWYVTADNRYTYVLYDPGLNCITMKITYDISNKKADIVLLDVQKLFDVDPYSFAFNAMGMAFRFLILWKDGFVVHSSSVVYDGAGVAFSAVSGTGKSTHTALWLKNYPDAYILNDDTPAIRLIDDVWYICGTPWAGSTGINENSIVSLKALVFLNRGKENVIRDCSAMEAIYRFFEAIEHPVSDEITSVILNSLNLLLLKSRVCLLDCNMEDEAAETVRKFLYETTEEIDTELEEE